jgi:hypothetical protein
VKNPVQKRAFRDPIVSRLSLATVAIAACAIAVWFGALGASGRASGTPPSVQASPQPVIETEAVGTYEGVITDTHCGAKHAPGIGQSAADCTRQCVHAGERFVLIDGDSAYVLEGDMMALKKMAGQRVRVTGKLNGNTIAVTHVAEV